MEVPGSRAWHRGPAINRLIGTSHVLHLESKVGERREGEARKRGEGGERSGGGDRGETGRRWGEREGW